MKLFTILKNKKYLAISVISSIIIFIVYPTIQVLATGGLQNLDLWFRIIPMFNLILVIIFSILFGWLLTLQIYNFRVKTCSIKNKRVSASTGGIGALVALVAPACPACLSFAVLLLPAATAVSFGQFLNKYSVAMLLISNSLIILGLFLLGGFKKDS